MPSSHPIVSIHIGGVFASHSPTIVRTVLGSCISVCLRDPMRGIGGMNHFMLPSCAPEEASARYGVHAMELLINECMKAGADRRLFEAKVFGGGHVLNVKETSDNVPKSNIRFALEFLKAESIPIVSEDIGGYDAREIRFQTASGKVHLRRLHKQADRISQIHSESDYASRQKTWQPPEDDSNITLF